MWASSSCFRRAVLRRLPVCGTAAVLGAVALSAGQAWGDEGKFQVRESSNPAGLITFRTTEVEAGKAHRVHGFPVISGNQRFGFWTFNGTRQAFPSGQAYLYPQTEVDGPVDAVAHFFPVTEDGDGDRLADWWEYWMFGDRSRGPQEDHDGDGLTHEEEFRNGYSARFRDDLADGGVSARLSAPLRLIVRNRLRYTFRSEPLGLVSASGELAPGETYTTPHLIGDVSGFTFVGFEVDGQPVRSASGYYLNRISVSPAADVEVVARYVPAGSDSDGDGIPDAVEYQNFGTLAHGPGDDPDDDGFTIRAELDQGLSLVAADGITSGGISSRLSPPLDYDRIRSRYLVRSQPLGLIPSVDELVVSGTARTSPHVGTGLTSGYAFGYWSVNGERVAAPDGVARRQVKLTVDEPTTLVAHFFMPSDDEDGDGLPDWWEWNLFGTREHTPSHDPDGDGLTIADERRLGLAVANKDDVTDGGISARLSAPLNYESGSRKRLLVRSSPLGIVPTSDQHLEAGSEVTSDHYNFTQLYSGYHFTHWSRNGARVADGGGYSRNRVVMELAEDTELVAHFTLPSDDVDDDGVPDFIELRLASDLASLDSQSDPDGDGLSIAEERRLGLAPLSQDSIRSGGISSRLSSPAALQFSVPPLALAPDGLLTVKGAPAGARVGMLAVSPAPAGRSYQFALEMGDGGEDNSRFVVVGNELRLAASLDVASARLLKIRIRGTDDLGVARSWQTAVHVLESLIAPIEFKTVAEEQPVEVTPAIAIPNMSNGPTVISVVSSPVGSHFDAASGKWSWTPGEVHGPGTYAVTFRADNGLMASDRTFQVTVTESNQAPVLHPVPPQNAAPGEPWTLQLTASDADLPANPLTFAISGAPAGATIDPDTGRITWTPGAEHAGSTVVFQASVSDGVASASITVEVRVETAGAIAGKWLEARFSDDVPLERRSLMADANGDGVSNLMAYSMGIHPESQEALDYPALAKDDEGEIQLVVRVRADDPALSTAVGTSAGLGDWSSHPLEFEPLGETWKVDAPAVTVASASDLGDGVWEVHLRLSRADSQAFFQIQVEYEP